MRSPQKINNLIKVHEHSPTPFIESQQNKWHNIKNRLGGFAQ
nr:MAG TPA: hypothetical protein [Caudoviricetes sp.]